MYNDMQVPLSPTMPIMNATQGCKYFMAGGTEKGGAGHGTRTFYTDGKKLCWTAKKTAGKGSVKSPTIKEVSKMRILSPEDWFTICDASGDGIIQESELIWLHSKARGTFLEGKDLSDAMAAMDSGQIDKAEFVAWFEKEDAQMALRPKTLKELRVLAEEMGIDEDKIEVARDEDEPKDALIALIHAAH